MEVFVLVDFVTSLGLYTLGHNENSISPLVGRKCAQLRDMFDTIFG